MKQQSLVYSYEGGQWIHKVWFTPNEIGEGNGIARFGVLFIGSTMDSQGLVYLYEGGQGNSKV